MAGSLATAAAGATLHEGPGPLGLGFASLALRTCGWRTSRASGPAGTPSSRAAAQWVGPRWPEARAAPRPARRAVALKAQQRAPAGLGGRLVGASQGCGGREPRPSTRAPPPGKAAPKRPSTAPWPLAVVVSGREANARSQRDQDGLIHSIQRERRISAPRPKRRRKHLVQAPERPAAPAREKSVEVLRWTGFRNSF